MLEPGFRATDHTVQVDVDNAILVRRGHQRERAALADAGVVEENIEPAAAPGDKGAERFPPLPAIADVEPMDACILGTDQPRCLRHASIIDVRDAHQPAALSEQSRGCTANARSGTGDENGLPHLLSPAPRSAWVEGKPRHRQAGPVGSPPGFAKAST
jgi:hypothetical protein